MTIKATPEQLDAFASHIDGAIRTPGEDGVNDGRLTMPYNRDNWRTATFTLEHAPELDAAIRPYAPFSPGEPVSVSVRHMFDPRNNDDFVYWVSPADKLGAFDEHGRAINLTGIGWFHQDSLRCFVQADQTVDLSEQQFSDMSAALLRTRVPRIDSLLETVSIKDALTLATLELRGQPLDEKLTKEVGVKTARNSASINGFHLDAYRFDHESCTGPAYSLARIAVRWTFRAELYEGLCNGIVLKDIKVRQQEGLPTTAVKTSKVSLMNNPYVNEDGTLGAYADTRSQGDTTPEQLRHLLFEDNEVTPNDLEYFLGLSTQPLQDTDIELSM